MRLPVTRSPRARRDLVEIAAFLGQRSPAIADRFLEAVERTLERLAEMPGVGSPWESAAPELADVRVLRIRGFPKYLLFYRATADGLDVVRVLHAARDLDNLLIEDLPSSDPPE